MRYRWSDIDRSIEDIETRRAVDQHTRECLGASRLARTHKREHLLMRYATYAGALVIGVNVGIMALIFNYVLLNMILHLGAG